MKFVVYVPHFAEITSHLEGIWVFIHLEVEFNLIHIDKLRLQLSKLRMRGIKWAEEDWHTRMAFELMEKIFTLLLNLLWVTQISDFFLLSKSPLILTTHFSIVHTSTDFSSSSYHAIIVHGLLISSWSSLSRSVGTLNIVSLLRSHWLSCLNAALRLSRKFLLQISLIWWSCGKLRGCMPIRLSRGTRLYLRSLYISSSFTWLSRDRIWRRSHNLTGSLCLHLLSG